MYLTSSSFCNRETKNKPISDNSSFLRPFFLQRLCNPLYYSYYTKPVHTASPLTRFHSDWFRGLAAPRNPWHPLRKILTVVRIFSQRSLWKSERKRSKSGSPKLSISDCLIAATGLTLRSGCVSLVWVNTPHASAVCLRWRPNCCDRSAGLAIT